jgi:hypothetical protein
MTMQPQDGLSISAYIWMLTAYFLPAIVAEIRGHHQSAAIFLTNLLLGWTGLGWIVALIWSATDLVPVGPSTILPSPFDSTPRGATVRAE